MLEAFGELISLEDEDEVLGEALWLLLGEVLLLADELTPVVELELDWPATLPLEGDCALASVEALGV